MDGSKGEEREREERRLTTPPNHNPNQNQMTNTQVNRVRASAARLAQVRHMAERLRLSVFGQLHKELRAWGPAAFRRAYLGACVGLSARVDVVGEWMGGSCLSRVLVLILTPHQHPRTHTHAGKGHGGQRRAFKVRFLGEGVNDYGGPYRAVFEQVRFVFCVSLLWFVCLFGGWGGGDG